MQVLTKYKLAGDMASRVIKAVRAECVAGKKTIDICKLGDELILKETGAVYNKQKEVVKKGALCNAMHATALFLFFFFFADVSYHT